MNSRRAQQVIILNGPAGVGKTTIGRLIAAKFQNGVCISGDALKAFIIHRTASVKGRLGYKNGASLVNNFIDAGYEMVVFEYVFPARKHVEYFKEVLQPTVPLNVNVFTLWAELATVQAREAKRSGRSPLHERVVECYREMEPKLAEFGTIINTENFSPQDIADRILSFAEQAS